MVEFIKTFNSVKMQKQICLQNAGLSKIEFVYFNKVCINSTEDFMKEHILV